MWFNYNEVTNLEEFTPPQEMHRSNAVLFFARNERRKHGRAKASRGALSEMWRARWKVRWEIVNELSNKVQALQKTSCLQHKNKGNKYKTTSSKDNE